MSPIDRTRDPRTPYTHERHLALAPDADAPGAIVYQQRPRPRPRPDRLTASPVIVAIVRGTPAQIVAAWEALARGEENPS